LHNLDGFNNKKQFNRIFGQRGRVSTIVDVAKATTVEVCEVVAEA